MSPLADKLRPKTLAEYIGQRHIVGEEKLLYKAIKSGNIFSMIFWIPALVFLFSLVASKKPTYAAWGFLIAVYGFVSGVNF